MSVWLHDQKKKKKKKKKGKEGGDARRRSLRVEDGPGCAVEKGGNPCPDGCVSGAGPPDRCHLHATFAVGLESNLDRVEHVESNTQSRYVTRTNS